MELSPLGCVGEIKEPIQRGTWIQDFTLARHGDHLSKNLKVRARVTEVKDGSCSLLSA